MPEYDSFDVAAEALAASNRGEASPASSQAPEQAQVATPEVDAGTTSTEDSFSNIDPNLLPPELQAQYRNMQGDYTRSKQRVAEQAKQYESFGNPEEVAQAVQLMQVLQDDPTYVYNKLSEYLQANGMSPSEANATANDIVNAQEEQPTDAWEDPAVAEVKALQKQVEEMQNWRSQQEAQARESAAIAQIQREEMDIRQRNPELKQEDVDAIYQLAFAHDGNLLQAETSFKALRDRLTSSYVDQKATVNTGVTAPGVTGSSQVPRTFSGLDDPELDAAATAALRAAMEG